MVAHIFPLLLAPFASKLVYYSRHCEILNFRKNRRHFSMKKVILPFSNIFQRLTVPRIIDQFGRKRCQKNRKDLSYQLHKKDRIINKKVKFSRWAKSLKPTEMKFIWKLFWHCHYKESAERKYINRPNSQVFQHFLSSLFGRK